ncbi:aryl-sulfate sulfotransferase [candidate division KSB1 bacterium]|nr:aryl-sulfate sulfotransferase [candidate division KSB1 bacterium]
MRNKILVLLIMLSNITRAGTYHQAIDYIFPLPNSKLLPVKTTVILKLDESYNDLITDLSDLIVVKDEGVVRDGNTFFATDNRTIIFKPNNDFQRGKTITVTVQLSQFGFDEFQYNFTIAKSSGNDLDWLNRTNVAASSSISEVQQFSPVRLINGVAVPSDFPEIHINILGETAPGRIFIPANKWIIICNNDGTPYFYWKYEDGYEKMRFEAHPLGVLSFHNYEVYDVILDQNFVEIDTVYPGHGYLPDDHELQVLENGHMLLVARDRVRIDMSEIVSGGNNNALVEAHHLQELDQDHNVIFEWRNWDHLDIRETEVSLQGGFIDYVHTNSIAIDYDGHYIISPREYDMVMKIDRITGETIWKLGGNNSDFGFINEDIEFSRIHDVRPVPGKQNQYTLFDNGRERDDGTRFSRAVEYKLNLTAMTAEKVWEYRHVPDLFTNWCGSCQPLENGNRLIGWAGNDYFTEVNSSEELVYEMYVSGFSCSRCRRDEWEGMMLHPYLILENMGTIIRLIFNKFGDPNVAHYNIYAGASAHSLSLFDTTKQTYYDLDANLLDDDSQYFFRVSAVNSAGEESEFSNQESVFIRITEPGENVIKNGDFENDFENWDWMVSEADADYQITNSRKLHFIIRDGGSADWNVQALYPGIYLVNGKKYLFEFDAYAANNRVVFFDVRKDGNPWTNFSKIGGILLYHTEKHYAYEFTMQEASELQARIVLNVGGDDNDVYIDNVSFKEIVESSVEEKLLPSRIKLQQNYPNPFNPSTQIEYDVKEACKVSLVVYNLNGQVVKELVNLYQQPGKYTINLDMQEIPSGIYFYKIKMGNFQAVKKMVKIE